MIVVSEVTVVGLIVVVVSGCEVVEEGGNVEGGCVVMVTVVVGACVVGTGRGDAMVVGVVGGTEVVVVVSPVLQITAGST